MEFSEVRDIGLDPNEAGQKKPSIKFAIIGCLHGQLGLAYKELENSQEKPDVLLICGDFQSIRNTSDLTTISIPKKYLSDFGDFYKYYNGELKAPILTIFVGGNHESSAYLREQYFGGWVAPNIYFLGNSGIINLTKGSTKVKIAGFSGIFKPYSFFQMYSDLPITEDNKKNCYHVREIETFKLSLYKNIESPDDSIGIFIGHDWPRGVTKYGNSEELTNQFKYKPFFKKDIQNSVFGNPAQTYLMKKLNPANFLVGHCHIGFKAEVEFPDEISNNKSNGNKVDMPKKTMFYACDKCLKQRKFQQFLDIYDNNSSKIIDQKKPHGLNIIDQEIKDMMNDKRKEFESYDKIDEPQVNITLELDQEWLAILKSVEIFQLEKKLPEKLYYYDRKEEIYKETDNYSKIIEAINLSKVKIMSEIKARISSGVIDLNLPDFEQSEPPSTPIIRNMDSIIVNEIKPNPQTLKFQEKIDSKVDIYEGLVFFKNSKFTKIDQKNLNANQANDHKSNYNKVTNSEEIGLNFDDPFEQVCFF